MATWNGGPFVAPQLESIAGQRRLPDEVVVVDDCSDDGTPAVVEEVAARCGLPVRLEHNEVRRGSTVTFGRAIEAADGDLIVLADQDDVWRPDKLSALESLFRNRPDLVYAFSDGELIDERDQPIAPSMWEARGFGPDEQDAVRRDPFGRLLHRWVVSGCTMAFPSSMRQFILPFPTWITEPFDPMVHDRWISLVLGGLGPVGVVDAPLVRYRIHGHQQIGMASARTRGESMVKLAVRKLTVSPDARRDFRDFQIVHLHEVHKRLVAAGDTDDAVVERVDAAIAHFEQRRDLPSSRLGRLRPVARELFNGRYQAFSNGAPSAGVDLLVR
ncbi:MAG: glycosyltransferase [Acidimicrobiia bacterium]|nr:glycosyltransferase [Acidimicrobiia bacterium]